MPIMPPPIPPNDGLAFSGLPPMANDDDGLAFSGLPGTPAPPRPIGGNGGIFTLDQSVLDGIDVLA